MEQFIAKVLRRVRADFEANVQARGCLCMLKELTYEGGHVPDYNDDFVQQYYMLRYFPAYLFEYYTIYNKILKSKLVRHPLNILSIGCGCGVDYYGLHFALKEHSGFEADLRYTGLDVAKWGYRRKLARDSVFFLAKDITEWNELDEDGYNILLFPKSISEFPVEIFQQIKKILANSTFTCQQICLACSVMDRGRDGDVRRFVCLAKTMKDAHGFSWSGNPTEFCYFTKDQGIKKLRPDWNYPEATKRFLYGLLEFCPTHKERGKPCKRACEVLNRWPILRTKQMAYQALGLVRD